MIKHKIITSVDLLKRLDTQFNETTNQNSLKVPKVVKQEIRKSYNKTLGTCVIKKPIVPYLSENIYHILVIS